IPAREVILATSRPAGLSLHNAVDAGVLAVEAAAHPGLAVIRLAAYGVELLALVTTDAVRKLDLRAGRQVLALIKSVSIDTFG
ncbi:MAG: TOBE domain-containing protein, partial [Gammaproteobacteria bacterium]